METITPTLSSLIAKEASKKFVVKLILIFALSIGSSYATTLFQTAPCGNAITSYEATDRPFPSGAIYFNQMKEIKLTQGKVALIDDEDFVWISINQSDYRTKWYAKNPYKNTWYARRNNGKNMHREIMKHHGLLDESKMIDHIDHNGLNNQKSNLRNATNSENQKNKRAFGTSKYLGVCIMINKNCRGWQVSITTNGKRFYLGFFKNEIEAALAYNEAAKIYHGEFANLNII